MALHVRQFVEYETNKNKIMMDPQQHPKQKQKHRVALVCNFFYPRLGGVEMHIWSLANCLLRLGHKVIIITHAYSCPKPSNDTSSPQHSCPIRESKRTGVRYLPGPIKVYYCPILPMVDEASVPTFCVTGRLTTLQKSGRR